MLDTQQIIDDVLHLAAGKKIWIAYSGGIDSHVLLHLLANSNHPELKSISAIHIDHGLHADSHKWVQHCAEISTKLNIEFCNIKVNVTDVEQLGMEAAARQARYQAFQYKLTKKDVLLTAQHQHDQAETLLLQLFRGAGPKGLSAMAERFLLGDLIAIRPLLNTSKQAILAYAEQHQLVWIDDPSNSETRWNRNYIRHTIWPDIEQRWPSAAKTISRSAEHCAEATELMNELAAQDLLDLTDDDSNLTLSISSLLALTPARYRNVLRYYIELNNYSMPSTACLQQIIDKVCLAKEDSKPLMSWQGVEVRRYQNALYFMSPLSEHDVNQKLPCSNLKEVLFNDVDILTWESVEQGGLREQVIRDGLSIRFRQGGEQIRPQGHRQHKTLKHLFQQWKIPTWLRDRIPLLYFKDELIAVVGYVLADDYVARDDEQGFLPVVKANK